MVEIELAYKNVQEIKELFKEYTDMLLEYDPAFEEYLVKKTGTV